MKDKLQRFLTRLWHEYRFFFFVVVFFIIPLKSSVADWNWVPTGSMKPTILEGDLVFINKAAYDLRFPLTMHRLGHWADPEHGDVVILFSPEDDMRLVKRVIGGPGDTIEMINNVIYLNDTPLQYDELPEHYLEDLSELIRKRAVFSQEDLAGKNHAVMTTPSIHANRHFPKVKIPDNHYLVMGDNRDNSKDSRAFGFVPRQNIIGKAKGVIISFDKEQNFKPRWKRFFSKIK